MRVFFKGVLLISTFLLVFGAFAQKKSNHPTLSLTPSGVEKIRVDLDKYPFFHNEYIKAKAAIDKVITSGLDVPIPKDMGGGYSHETHKSNYKILQKAGNIYQISGEEKYAEFVKKVLMEYAEMYPTLTLHPAEKSYARGKFFWQCLNDANWMVFTSQAYDCIYNYLTKKERTHLEQNLFLPYANFLSEENPRFFNRIHNHSTWANAAVGMMALAMENDSLLQKALYGIKNDGINLDEIENKSGYIVKEGMRQAGFLAQLDYSFSPNGYFSEGPYYQRYAIFPFLVFSYALHNSKPGLDIFNYRDGILKKATNTLLQLTNPQGEFFPINDAQKGMDFTTYELVTAVDLMYWVDDSQEELLAWANAQQTVTLNEAGFYVAQKIEEIKKITSTTTPILAPIKKPVLFGDGVNGNEGGIAILRANKTDLLFKFSAQGMGHGHFDRLSYALYNDSGEVVQDYGAVRWVNIDQKGGGRYLPENKTFGKQSIAHNTLTVDETSHYEASVKKAEKAHPELYIYNVEDKQQQIVSAIEKNAYEDVDMHRTFIMIEDAAFTNPLIIDLFLVQSETTHTYDLANWYSGHFMKSNATCENETTSLTPLGDDYGYQHIWKQSTCSVEDKMHTFNWFGNNQFYTKYTVADSNDQFILGRAGANDPNHNLRPDPVLIHRKENQTNSIFLNIIESHGTYSPITEVPIQPFGTIEKLIVDYSDDAYIAFHFTTDEQKWQVCFSNKNNNLDTAQTPHQINFKNQNYTWKGALQITKTNLKI